MLYQSRLSYLGQLTGNHFLDEKKLHSLAWNMGYSYAYRTEPDRRIVVNQAGMSDGVDVSQLKVGNEASNVISNLCSTMCFRVVWTTREQFLWARYSLR